MVFLLPKLMNHKTKISVLFSLWSGLSNSSEIIEVIGSFSLIVGILYFVSYCLDGMRYVLNDANVVLLL